MQKLSINTLLWMGAFAVAFGLLFYSATLWNAASNAAKLRTAEAELRRLNFEMVGAVGYNGMIHDFKNCVLRGASEPVYCDEAEEEAQLVLNLSQELLALSEREDFRLSLGGINAAATAYSSRIQTVRDAHARGVPIDEIDRTVRYPDPPAIGALSASLELASQLLDERLTRIRETYYAATTLGLFGLLALSIWFILSAIRQHRKLVVKQAQLDAVFQGVSGGVIGLDRDGRIMLANPKGRELLLLGPSDSLTLDKRIDWPPEVLLLPGDTPEDGSGARDERPAILDRVLRGPSFARETRRMVQGEPQQTARYVQISSARVAQNDIGGLAAILFMDDITREVRTRRAIERNSRLDALGQLSGGIAHDFNNILATILYAVNLSLKEPVSERVQRLLLRVDTSVKRGRNLTERLLAFARRQPGSAESRRIEDVFSDLKILARPGLEADIELLSQVETPDLMVYCDIGQLENALLNLVLNAREAIVAAGRPGKIQLFARNMLTTNAALTARQIGTRPEDHAEFRFVEISITDNGIGMSADVRRRAMDPFFTTRPKSGGTGLGLPMVYAFVQQSRGEMQIYSEKQQGTAVRLLLPRGADIGREQPREKVDPAEGNGECVLLVDDEPDLLGMMAEVLEDLGYEVLTAATGREAWERIEDGLAFDILLSDIVMPGGIDGVELATRVQARDPGKPVVLMSGYASLKRPEDADERWPFVRKPSPPEELAAVLRKAISDRGV